MAASDTVINVGYRGFVEKSLFTSINLIEGAMWNHIKACKPSKDNTGIPDVDYDAFVKETKKYNRQNRGLLAELVKSNPQELDAKELAKLIDLFKVYCCEKKLQFDGLVSYCRQRDINSSRIEQGHVQQMQSLRSMLIELEQLQGQKATADNYKAPMLANQPVEPTVIYVEHNSRSSAFDSLYWNCSTDTSGSGFWYTSGFIDGFTDTNPDYFGLWFSRGYCNGYFEGEAIRFIGDISWQVNKAAFHLAVRGADGLIDGISQAAEHAAPVLQHGLESIGHFAGDGVTLVGHAIHHIGEAGEAAVNCIGKDCCLVVHGSMEHCIEPAIQGVGHCVTGVGSGLSDCAHHILPAIGGCFDGIGHGFAAVFHGIGSCFGALTSCCNDDSCKCECDDGCIKIVGGGAGATTTAIGSAVGAAGGGGAAATTVPMATTLPLSTPAPAVAARHLLAAAKQYHITNPALALAAEITRIAETAILAPRIFFNLANLLKNLYMGYKIKQSAIRFAAQTLIMGAAFTGGWWMPYGGPNTAWSAILLLGLAADVIPNFCISKYNRKRYLDTNPSKHMIRSDVLSNYLQTYGPQGLAKINAIRADLIEIAKEEKLKGRRQSNLLLKGMHLFANVNLTNSNLHETTIYCLKALMSGNIDSYIKLVQGLDVAYNTAVFVIPGTNPEAYKRSGSDFLPTYQIPVEAGASAPSAPAHIS